MEQASLTRPTLAAEGNTPSPEQALPQPVPQTVQTVPQTVPQTVVVEIYDQIYHLRGVDPEYIERLAAVVDGKMRAVSARGGTVDSLRVAVLAALNIADELATLRERYDDLAGTTATSQTTMRNRAGSLAGMLDEVLDGRLAG
ncbi:MAG TPA: cell division protein ZapA [Granulicella sp.]|jgi:cell division protein ZapA|nr:cell division protein ZapA [Granulicella sp.]